MKNYLLIFFSIVLFSCNKEELEITDTFEVTVIGEGFDCHLLLIDFQEKDSTRIENFVSQDWEKGWFRFNAHNLEKEYNIPGQALKVKVRKTKKDELHACTTRDPGYHWVTVLSAELIE